MQRQFLKELRNSRVISQINFFSVSGAVVLLTAVALMAIFLRFGSSKLHKLWALFNFFVGTWGLSVFLIGSTQDVSVARQLWKLANFSGIFLSAVFFHTTLIYCGEKRPKLLAFSYSVAFACVLLDLGNLLNYDIQHVFNLYYIELRGPELASFAIYWIFLASYSLVMLHRHYKNMMDPVIRNQAKYLLFGMLIGFVGGATHWFPIFSIPIYPFGQIGIAIYSSIVAYAILKHGLLDIEVVIRRTAVFAGLFAFVYGIFTIITIVGQEIFRDSLNWNQWLVMVPTVLIITFGLRPLENYLTEVTEKFLFQKEYDYRELLKTFTNEVLTVLDLQKLTDQTIIGLNKIIKLESAGILLNDKDAQKYTVVASLGVKDRAVTFSEKDTIVSFLRQTHQPILKDKSVDEMAGYSNLREEFKKLNARLCLPIAHHDELIGILSLGLKKSGEEFTQEDIDILITLSRTLAIAIANARLFDQLSKTQAEAAQREKMAVIGTLAAGINHEICNPLGIVRGQCEMYLLNLRDGLYDKKSRDEMNAIASEIMNKVIKETDRATAITKKLSGFAKPSKRIENEEVYIEKEADEVIGLIGHDLKLNNIEFKKQFSDNFPGILADKRQIQEVLFNIIRNAAQAMERDKKDGWISLSGSLSNGSAIIRIADNGSGIPADKLGQIFNPFFTTKEPGKGTGLGLFIVRQVIERNKGTITVESQEGVGTTFTLTFPLADQTKVLAA